MSDKLLIICGPTATGKTDLGISLAKKFNGEIISADSRQVYQGMNIGTGKDLPLNSELRIKNQELKINENKLAVGFRVKENIPIWLVDMVKPDYQFNLGEYAGAAQKVIKNIGKRGKLPIILGGTGLYVKALIEPLELINIPQNSALRNRLVKDRLKNLQKELQKINSVKFSQMNNSDRQNKRRLIRAIEISLFLEDKTYPKRKRVGTDYLLIGLKLPNASLYQRIDQRVQSRVNSAFAEEIDTLLKSGYTWKNSVLGATFGYQQWQKFFEGEISQEEAVKNWQYAEHAYARRQITWFKKMIREKHGIWFNVGNKEFLPKLEMVVKKWYTLS